MFVVLQEHHVYPARFYMKQCKTEAFKLGFWCILFRARGPSGPGDLVFRENRECMFRALPALLLASLSLHSLLGNLELRSTQGKLQ